MVDDFCKEFVLQQEKYMIEGKKTIHRNKTNRMNDADIEGNLLHQFETIMDFFTRNLRHIQVEDEFNSKGVLEIPYTSLVEFTVNALVHRSLNVKAPIRIFIFDDRVEIHSPGTLPNGLTVDDIVVGTSMPRNMFLLQMPFIYFPTQEQVVVCFVHCRRT